MKTAVSFLLVATSCAAGPSPRGDGPRGTATSLATGFAAESPAAPGRYADVHGLRMYYEVHGQGPPLVFLHGGTSTVSIWPGRATLELFAARFRVIAPEQIGHGHTADDPSRPLHLHAMAEDTVELLRQLGIDGAYFVGWSDGAAVALDIAHEHPALVKKLVTSGAPIHPAANDAVASAWLRHVKAECSPGDKPGRDCWPSSIRDAYLREAPDPRHWSAFLDRVKAMWLTEPEMKRDDLAKITAKTLVVAGDHDSTSLHDTTELFEAIPGAALWIVPESDHFLPIQRAPMFNATVATFLDDKKTP